MEWLDGRVHVYSWFDFSPDALRFRLAVCEECGKETAFLVVRVHVAILNGPGPILMEACCVSYSGHCQVGFLKKQGARPLLCMYSYIYENRSKVSKTK